MPFSTETIQGLVGGGGLTSIVAYIINKKNNKADFLTKVENIYTGLANVLKADNEKLKEEIKEIREDFKLVRADYRLLQEQFNTIQIAYAREIERSQNWEKLHTQLSEKYDILEKDYESLKSFCEKIKLELDKYKKTHKLNESKN